MIDSDAFEIAFTAFTTPEDETPVEEEPLCSLSTCWAARSVISAPVATGTDYRRLRRSFRSSSKVRAGRTFPAFI
jgi:hypothetical protein